MKITISEASLKDEADIRSFLTHVIHESLEHSIHNIDSILEDVNKNVDFWMTQPEASIHLLAKADGKIGGALLIKEYWNLCSLFVHPELQRKGIGKSLVLSALELCREKSPCRALFLNANDEAIPFYRALGFDLRKVKKAPPAGSTPMELLFN